MLKEILTLLVVGILCSSCGMVKRGTNPWENRAEKKKMTNVTQTSISTNITTKSTSTSSSAPILTKDEKAIKSSLDLAYKDWKGVPYVLGGTGYKGVDCSSFMQIVFEDYFEIKLPRNTLEQMKQGSSVRKSRILLGDLVFFKTGRSTFHVGVMVNKEEFLHASTSSGVMISSLSDKYWKDRYLTTRRIL